MPKIGSSGENKIYPSSWSCLSIGNPLAVTLLQATLALQEAASCCLSLKPCHDFLHSAFFQTHIWDPSLSDEHHKAITRLVSLEALHESYCHIQTIQNHLAGCSISLVKYSPPAGTVLPTSHTEVEAALSTALQSCFTCAHRSPFLNLPLAPLVIPYGTGPATKEILTGTFHCPPDTDN